MKCNKFISLIFIGIYFLSFTSCEKDEAETYSLPPLSSMDMDFTSFTSMKKSALITDSTSNFIMAKSIVTYWSGRADSCGNLPLTAFKKAFGTAPSKTVQGTWLWTYNFNLGASEYVSKIEAKIITAEDSVEWKLSISQVEGSKPFTYCTGKSATNISGGWWKLNSRIGEVSVPFMKIDWKYVNENEGSIRYTNIIPGDDDNGGYIEFAKVDDTVFNRYFKLYIVNYKKNTSLNGKVVTINWHNTNKNGQITVGEDVYGCWDKNLVNKENCD